MSMISPNMNFRYNPAPTGQYPQMLGFGQQPQSMPSMQPMQNMMPPQSQMGQMGGSMGSPLPSGYTPPPGFMPQGQAPGPGWTGNNFGAQPMGGQTPSMSPGSSPPNYGPQDTSGFSQSASGSTDTGQPQTPPAMTGATSQGPTPGPGIAGGSAARQPGTPNGINSFLPGGSQFGSMPPGMNQGGAPKRPPIDPTMPSGGVSPFSGGQGGGNVAAQYPLLAQNAGQSSPTGGPGSNMTPGGNNSNGPIPAPQSAQSPPMAGPQPPMMPQGQDTGYAGGGSSGYMQGSGNNGGSTPFQLAGTGPTITPQYIQQLQAQRAADPSFNRNNSLANFRGPFTGMAANPGGPSQGPQQSGMAPLGYSAPVKPYVPMWQRKSGAMI